MAKQRKNPSLGHLAERWHRAPRRWGHALHSLCSYMAMFPPAIPHVFIRWLTEPGDVVYDPFSGRGTTTLEACLLGRVGLGSDANPLAWLLTAAKVDLPSQAAVAKRLDQLGSRREEWDIADEPEHIRMLFSPGTLGRLLWLREELSLRRKVDRFVMATLLGVLHANALKDGTPRGLTVAMPNTFSMAPGYVARYIKEKGLRPPDVDPLEVLEKRVHQFEFPNGHYVRGKAWRQDATSSVRWPKSIPPAKLVFTSPPYLEVVQYGKFNWIRLWLLGEEPKAVDQQLFTSSSLDRYLEFTNHYLRQIRPHVRDDGFVCLMIGDVRRGDRHLNLARAVIKECVPTTDLQLVGLVADRLPTNHKVSRIWKNNRGRATKTDRIMILAGPNATSLPPLGRIRWEDH